MVGEDKKEREIKSYLKLVADDCNDWYQTMNSERRRWSKETNIELQVWGMR